METKKLCFTGHRSIKNPDALRERLTETLCFLIENRGVTDFYAGGALGFDMMCEETVIELRERYPFIRLHLILPCGGHFSNWQVKDKIRFRDILRAADSSEYLATNYYNGCMKARNERLVAKSDICLCYYDAGNYASGTGQTVRMAQKKGIEIINIY